MAMISRWWRAPVLLLQCTRFSSSVQKPVVLLKDGLTVKELANKLQTKSIAVSKLLKDLGERSTHQNARLSSEVAELVAMGMGFTPNLQDSKTHHATPIPRSHDVLKPRPPIVTVMGHVDHGKTTLLDTLRSTSVAANEAGGITQHIGAFSVSLSNGRTITFLDTPGHAAFSSMRERGAQLTDVVVLVVAADDGVMPQTIESIKLAEEARVPIVVAINKCDKHEINISKVKQQLLQYSIQLEEFGGETQAIEVSALTGKGIEALEEAIIAQAEMSNIEGDYTGPVEGLIVESRTDKGLGHIATVLVKHGVLRCGCVLVAGEGWAKIRTMTNHTGERMKEATPSTPVLTSGWRELPLVGEKCLQVTKESEASQVVNRRRYLNQRISQTHKSKHKRIDEETDELTVPLIVKGDVGGSVEALLGIIESAKPHLVRLDVVHTGIGGVSDSDIEMASSVDGIILAFNVTSTKVTSKLALQKEVTIISHNVIYKLLELLKEYLEQQLPNVDEEEIIGEAIVLKVFKLRGNKSAAIGGCRVKKGQLIRDAIFQIWRDEDKVHEGRLIGMKREKDNISSARKETECGLSFNVDPKWQEGDRVVCLRRKKVPQKLEWHLGF